MSNKAQVRPQIGQYRMQGVKPMRCVYIQTPRSTETLRKGAVTRAIHKAEVGSVSFDVLARGQKEGNFLEIGHKWVAIWEGVSAFEYALGIAQGGAGTVAVAQAEEAELDPWFSPAPKFERKGQAPAKPQGKAPAKPQGQVERKAQARPQPTAKPQAAPVKAAPAPQEQSADILDCEPVWDDVPFPG